MKITKIFEKKGNLLDGEIQRIIFHMNAVTVGSDEYDELLEKMERLYELRYGKKVKISPDTMMVVAGNLLGILLILNYEKMNVITTKAMGFVIRGRA